MRVLLLSGLGIFFPSLVFSGSVITLNKNEMTGEMTQAYLAVSSNHSDQTFTVTCEPKWGLSFKFCRSKYKYLPDQSCHLSFDYKFDNGQIEKHKWSYNRDLAKAYASYKPFLLKVMQHNKVTIAPYPDLPSMPTPVFNIADFKHKIKQFGAHCQLEVPVSAGGEQSQQAKPAPGSSSPGNSHFHGDRQHSHPLPAQGVAHKHGNGVVGTAK